MTGNTRIPKAELTGIYGAVVKRISRRMLGDVAEPVEVTWHNRKVLAKAREVPRWRESDVFAPLERDVLEYAEAMTVTPPTVTDELSARLLDALGPAALVELTAFVAVANLMTRPNTAFGIESQGFAASCGLKPLAVRSTTCPATRSSRTAVCFSLLPTRCSARPPTRKTSCRRRGCGGSTSTGRTSAIRARTWFASSRGRP